MDRLKIILETYPTQWQTYDEYINRILGFRNTDFSTCIENCKALIEGIARNICDLKGTAYTNKDGVGKLVKLAFDSFGYPSTDPIRSMGASISNVSGKISDIRNQIGATAHGKSADELRKRNEIYNSATQDFLILSTEMVACLLIELFEADAVKIVEDENGLPSYDENEDFNAAWDDTWGKFTMNDYSFFASQILYQLDPLAYTSELNAYKLSNNETGNGE